MAISKEWEREVADLFEVKTFRKKDARESDFDT